MTPSIKKAKGNSGNKGDKKKPVGPATREPITSTTSTGTASTTRESTTAAPVETKVKIVATTTKAPKKGKKMTKEEGLLFNGER